MAKRSAVTGSVLVNEEMNKDDVDQENGTATISASKHRRPLNKGDKPSAFDQRKLEFFTQLLSCFDSGKTALLFPCHKVSVDQRNYVPKQKHTPENLLSDCDPFNYFFTFATD